MTPQDTPQIVKQLTEYASRAKFGPGVVGKTSMVMLGVPVIWVVVICRLSVDFYVDALMVVCASISTTIVVLWCRRMERFAERNPSLALMEGADITAFRRFQAETKDAGSGSGPSLANPSRPRKRRAPPKDQDTDRDVDA